MFRDLQQLPTRFIIVSTHWIKVEDRLLPEIHHLDEQKERKCWANRSSNTNSQRKKNKFDTHREAPVHTQVNRNQQDVFRKDIHLFGPAAHGRVAAAAQLGVEECVERVDGWKLWVGAALHQQVHVKVDDLRCWREKENVAVRPGTKERVFKIRCVNFVWEAWRHVL